MLRLARERDRLSIVDDQIGGADHVHRARPRHARDRHRHSCRPLRRCRGLGGPLPHDLRRFCLVVWLCSGHLWPRRRAARSQTAGSYGNRHERVSHPGCATAQLGACRIPRCTRDSASSWLRGNGRSRRRSRFCATRNERRPCVFARAIAIKKKALRKSRRAGADARTTAGQETGATV